MRKFSSNSKKEKEIFKINLVILKNLELQLSVTIHHIGANSILDNTVGEVIIIRFLRNKVFFFII